MGKQCLVIEILSGQGGRGMKRRGIVDYAKETKAGFVRADKVLRCITVRATGKLNREEMWGFCDNTGASVTTLGLLCWLLGCSNLVRNQVIGFGSQIL